MAAKIKKINKQQQAKQHERRQVITALLCIAILGFAIRTIGAWGYTFNNGSGDIWFRGNDAWYHYRLIENMAANWPHIMTFDALTGYPNGSVVVAAPLLSWLVVGMGKILAFGAPSEHLLKTLAVLLPPVAAIATILPVYFIGREVYGRWTGVVAAGLVTLLPSQFLSRSILGFADHHVLETLFSTTAILFLILGYKRRQARWYALAGVALATYFLAWHGALFILSVLLLWVFVQYVCDMYKGTVGLRENYVRIYGPAITSVVTIILWLPFRNYNADWKVSLLFFAILIGLAPLLDIYRRAISRRLLWWTALIGTAAAGVVLMILAIPGFRDTMTIAIQITFPTHMGVRSIGETKALDPKYFMSVYAANLLTAGTALYWTFKERHEFLLIALWGILMLMFTITQMRWEYYLIVPLALLSAYGFVRIGTLVRKEVKRGSSLITLVFLLFATSIAGIGFASTPSLMTGDWHEALTWMRDNTPEPYDHAAYYELDNREVADYAVMSWWDYGHFITQVARRVPIANPFQANVDVTSRFFVDGIDVPEVRYVMIDNAMIHGKWYAMPSWLLRYVAPGTPAPPDSPVYRMCTGDYPGWIIIHQNQSVIILERDNLLTK